MTVPPALTRREQSVIDVIRSAVLFRGYPPSIREIAAATGITSVSTVHQVLTALEGKGAVRREPGRPRAITVLDPVATP